MDYANANRRSLDSILMGLRDTLLVTVWSLAFVQLVLPVGIPHYLFVFAAFGLSSLLAVWRQRVEFPNPLSLLLILLVCANAGLLLIGTLSLQRVENIVLADMIAAALLVAFVIVGCQSRRDGTIEQIASISLWLLCGIGIVGAILGAVKLYLFTQGITIDWIVDRANDEYPWGTSWRADYNFYSFGLLCGAIAALHIYATCTAALLRWGLLISWILIVAAGVLSGSRRFLLLLPLFVLIEVFLLVRRGYGRRLTTPVYALLIGSFAVIAYIPGEDLLAIIQLSLGQLDLAARASSVVDITDPSGLSQREARWEAAFQLFEHAFYGGEGFRYLDWYGQKFVGGRALDYPHNPILSAALYGGFFGLLFSVAFYAFNLYVGVRLLLGRAMQSTFGVLLLASLGYLLVSSNTIFSIWSSLILLGIATLLEGLPSNGNKSRSHST